MAPALGLLTALATAAPSPTHASPSQLGQPYGKPPVTVPPPVCARCPTVYSVASGFGWWTPTSSLTVTYRNVGRTIPHLILRIDSFGTFTISSVSATLTLRGATTTLAPRRLRTIPYPTAYTQRDYHVRERAGYVYVYEIGQIPAGAHVEFQAKAHLTQKPCCHETDLIDAFGRFNAQGLPDLKAGVENGGTFSSGDV